MLTFLASTVLYQAAPRRAPLPPPPPRFANARAKQTAQAMENAYARLKSVRITIQGDGVTHLLLSGRRAREERKGLVWAYDSKTLTVRTKNRFYRGKGSRTDVVDAVGTLAGGVDPFLRRVFLRRVAFRDLLEGQTVRLLGTLRYKGALCDILEASGAGRRTSIFVRRKDHLVAAVDTENLEGGNRDVLTSRRSFAYAGINGPIPVSQFRLSPRRGEKVLPLPPPRLM